MRQSMMSSRKAGGHARGGIASSSQELVCSVLLLGGTTTALATPSLLDWVRFTPDQTIQNVNAEGDLCAAGMMVRPEGVPDDDPSFVAAREIFLAIDFTTLDIPDHIRRHQNLSASEGALKDMGRSNGGVTPRQIAPRKPSADGRAPPPLMCPQTQSARRSGLDGSIRSFGIPAAG